VTSQLGVGPPHEGEGDAIGEADDEDALGAGTGDADDAGDGR
jgi:hypothetical protein